MSFSYLIQDLIKLSASYDAQIALPKKQLCKRDAVKLLQKLADGILRLGGLIQHLNLPFQEKAPSSIATKKQ